MVAAVDRNSCRHHSGRPSHTRSHGLYKDRWYAGNHRALSILIPLFLFAVFGSSRHLVVGADSATAAILAAGLVGIASVGSDQYVALPPFSP